MAIQKINVYIYVVSVGLIPVCMFSKFVFICLPVWTSPKHSVTKTMFCMLTHVFVLIHHILTHRRDDISTWPFKGEWRCLIGFDKKEGGRNGAETGAKGCQEGMTGRGCRKDDRKRRQERVMCPVNTS